MKGILLILFVGVFATLTTQAQIVHTDDVEIEKSDGAKLDMTHTGTNKTWRLVSGLYNGFQIGYLTGNLTGTSAPFYIGEQGWVGINTTSPVAPLTVNGDISISSGFGVVQGSEPLLSAVATNTFLGLRAGKNTTSANNTFMGRDAGMANTSGSQNTLVGYYAGVNNLTGFANTFMGSESGRFNTTGAENTFIGWSSGRDNTVGVRNSFVGLNSGRTNTTGSYNAFFGYNSGGSNLTGEHNMFIGRQAGYGNTSGSRNAYIGSTAGAANNGDYNVFIGEGAGSVGALTNKNVAIGYHAGKLNNASNGGNTFIGTESGNNNTTGEDNVAIGHKSGRGFEGVKNVAIGMNAGGDNTSTGSYNVFLGHEAGLEAGNDSERLYIANRRVSQRTALIYGEFDTGKVGINTTTLDANSTLTVGGDLSLDGDLRLDTNFGIKMDNAPFISRIGSSLVMGVNAGNVAMTGASNVFVGALSGQSNTSGNKNAYFGEGAGSANTTGFRNVYLGALSGNSSVLGAENTFVGFQSGYEAEGSRNTFLGGMAGRYTVNGTANTSIGYGAGGNSSSTTGENTFIGAYAGEHGINSKRSVAIGFRAGSDVDGDKNVLIGYQAGSGDTNASNSLYIANTTYDAAGGALIYGRFDQGKVGINTRNLDANSTLTVDGRITADEIYLKNGTSLVAAVSSPWIASASDITFATGKVGIGTTGPVANLDVRGNGNVAQFGNNAYEDQYVSIRNSTTGGLLGITPTTDGGVFQFQAGNNKGMRFMVDGAATGTAWSTGINAIEITKNGKVGINTTNLDANAALTVGGQFAINDTDLLGSFTSSTLYAWLEIGNSTGSSTLGYNNDFFWINAGPAAPVNGFTIKDDNVGIGTIGESRLHVKDGGQEMKFLTGTNSSGYRLDVGVNDDGVNFSNNSSSRGFNFNNNTGRLVTILSNGSIEGPDGESILSGFKNIRGRSTDGILHLRAGTTSGRVFVNHYETGDIIMANGGGDVGIGTTSPSAKLDVNGNAVFHGKIESTKVKVSTTPQGGWPDYVFEPEFRLRPLSEVEAFVNENKHLPEVPSAKEVAANGIDLGNMDATLLKKVEELTLYMIEMNKKIEKLEEENKQLKELVKKDK